MRKVKKYLVIAMMMITLATVPTGGCSRSEDFHQTSDDKWLIEQVEQGYLTQEQADAIRNQHRKE